MFRKILIGVVAIVALAAAPASAQYPYTVTPGDNTPGGSVSVSGQGCAAGATVVIHLKRVGPVMLRSQDTDHGEIVVEVIADDDGNFNATFDLAGDIEVGTYAVTSVCDDVVQTANITVDAAPTTTAPPATTPGRGSDLSRTGSDLNGFGLIGAGLLAGGGLLLVAARRRTASA